MILNIPHSAIDIPNKNDFLPEIDLNEQLLYMTDWYTHLLFTGYTSVVYPISRLVCDIERLSHNEPMDAIGMGIIYEKGYDLKQIRKPVNSSYYVDNYYIKYHRMIAKLVEQELQEFGKCLIIDCHSFHPTPLPYEKFMFGDKTDKRPDICIGYHNANRELLSITEKQFSNYSVEFNNPYSGAFVPLPFINHKNVSSIMIELNRGIYLEYDDTTQPKKKLNSFYDLQRNISHFLAYIRSVFYKEG